MVHLSMTNIMNKFRICEVRGWHIIYQLSDGTWASKNRHRRSTNRAPNRLSRNQAWSCPDLAALAWADHYFSWSAFTRHEHSALIYTDVHGRFRLSETVNGRVHEAYGLSTLYRNMHDAGYTIVAFVHTHPEGLTDGRFSPGDLSWARAENSTRRRMNAYVVGAGPWGNWGTENPQLFRFRVNDGSVDPVPGTLTFRYLELTEQFYLEREYRGTWNNRHWGPDRVYHTSANCTWGTRCRTIRWPNAQWPPQ